MTDKRCHEIITGYELVVVQCDGCGFHMGLDATYLDQVGSIEIDCPSCGTEMHVGSGEPGYDVPAAVQQAFIDKNKKERM